MRISIVVPTFNEEPSIGGCLRHLRETAPSELIEIIVVDGGSRDKTLEMAQPLADQVMMSPKIGRGAQMHYGALHTKNPLLMFLHADARLPENWYSRLKEIWLGPHAPAATAFSKQFDDLGKIYRFIAYGSRIRSSLTGIPHGDQAIVIRKDVYIETGGVPDVPLMEEYILGRKIRQCGRIHFLKDKITTSVRRYVRRGPFTQALTNIMLICGFYLHVPVKMLALIYYRNKRS